MPPFAVSHDGVRGIDAEIRKVLRVREGKSQGIQVVLETDDAERLPARRFLVGFDRGHRVRRRAETHVPKDQRFRPQPFRQTRLLDIKLARFPHRIGPRMHDLAGRNLADAGETFPGVMDLVITEAKRSVTFHFKIALVFAVMLQFKCSAPSNSNQRIMKRITILLAVLALGASVLRADLNLPDVSQLAVTKQRIALTVIKVTYHRPLVNGRKIWGGLVPLGEVWRAGANENTLVDVSDAITVEGQPLPKGTYGLHMIPTADSWTVILSKMATAWGSYSYDQKEDALRVTVKPRANEMEEALEYAFEDLTPDSATLTLKWEKLAVPVKIAVSPETTVAN